MVKVVNIHEAKTHLSRLVEEVAAGAEVVVAKSGRPMARLTAIASGPPAKRLGLLRGRFSVPADFNSPLDRDVLGGFEGR